MIVARRVLWVTARKGAGHYSSQTSDSGCCPTYEAASCQMLGLLFSTCYNETHIYAFNLDRRRDPSYTHPSPTGSLWTEAPPGMRGDVSAQGIRDVVGLAHDASAAPCPCSRGSGCDRRGQCLTFPIYWMLPLVKARVPTRFHDRGAHHALSAPCGTGSFDQRQP